MTLCNPISDCQSGICSIPYLGIVNLLLSERSVSSGSCSSVDTFHEFTCSDVVDILPLEYPRHQTLVRLKKEDIKPIKVVTIFVENRS